MKDEDALLRDEFGPSGSCIISIGCFTFLIIGIAAAIKVLKETYIPLY